MTNLEALIAEVEPYTVSPFTYSKKLADGGINESADYTSENKREIAKCAISILIALLPLSSDSTGRASQSYNREGLEDRIKALCAENDLDAGEYIEEPTVIVYHNLF
ncbi:MAG: hypothetical protein IJR84_09205 [Bacteroidaceae bacterium]|nr:hypothetical protein [Bacteroidaceae bacterium]